MFSQVIRRVPIPLTRAIMTSSSPQQKKYFMLTYDYVENVVDKRAPFRTDHLNLAKQYVADGRLVLGGAFADPIDSAAIVFRVDDKREVEDFVKNDPYVQGKIVTKWAIREWTVVVGGGIQS